METVINWQDALTNYRSYLKLERSLSQNTISAYMSDVESLKNFCVTNFQVENPQDVEYRQLLDYMGYLKDQSLAPRSQARFVASIKSFFKFLVFDNVIESSPARLLETPKLGRKLPQILTVDEIEAVLSTFDQTTWEGKRNHTMIELLYSAGVRVTELAELKISNIHLDKGFLKVEGKGNKERLIPLGEKASQAINEYLSNFHILLNIPRGYVDYLFVNRYFEPISRISIFNIIKKSALQAGIKKNISPHTYRHSFATHLVSNGADLRAVQDMLGHESILTTEIYTHLDQSYMRDAVVNHHPRSSQCVTHVEENEK